MTTSSKSKRSKPEAHACACGDHVFASLTQGFVTLVSPEDRHFLEEYLWQAHRAKCGVYARRCPVKGEKGILLHRQILDVADGHEGDHGNLNTLDNRRSNLREAETSQNRANRRPFKRRSTRIPEGVKLPKGVTFDPARKARPYRARIGNRHIGLFDCPVKAGEAYDAHAAQVYGQFARLNGAAS